MMMFAFPYWLEATLVVLLIVGGFVFIIYKDGNIKVIPEAFKSFFQRLYDMIFLGIEDREAYNANEEQRKKDEEYKKQMKKK